MGKKRKNNNSNFDKNKFEKTVSKKNENVDKVEEKEQFPKKFPFWARFKKNKNRTTLVIDEEKVKRKNSEIEDDCFVHRESTHTYRKDYEEIYPNPDITDLQPMYLKRPRKHPKVMFRVHNKNLDMPQHLIEKYDKNNKNKK